MAAVGSETVAQPIHSHRLANFYIARCVSSVHSINRLFYAKEIQMNFQPLRLIALVIILFSSPAFAENDTARSDFDSLVKANVFNLEMGEHGLSGEGADWLVKRGAEVQHFLLGERHATAEIPQFSAMLFRDLVAEGYDVAALEFGPVEGVAVEAALRNKGLKNLRAAITNDSGQVFVAFLDWQEEADMASDMIAAVSGSGPVLWGLDQAYVFSGPLYLERLRSLAQTDAEKEAVAAAVADLANNPDWVASGDEQKLYAMKQVFAVRGDISALAIFDQLLASKKIYSPYSGNAAVTFAESDRMREDLMKRTFFQFAEAHRARTGNDPRVFLKFGGFHSAKAWTTQGKVALGTFVDSYAIARGQETFALYVDCYGGLSRSTGGGDHPEQPCPNCFASGGGQNTGEAEVDLSDHPLGKFLAVDEPTLINLRALRPRIREWKFLDEISEELILSFDAYLALPNVHPATDIR